METTTKATPPVTEAPVKTEPVAVAEKGDAPLASTEDFTERFDQLAARARAAGLNPVQEMVRTYVRRGLRVLDSLLSGLEDGTPKKKG